MERIRGLAWDLMDAIYEVNYDGVTSEFSVKDKEFEALSIVIFSVIVERMRGNKKFKLEAVELINEYKKECKDYSEIFYRMTEIGDGLDVDGMPINDVENISYDIDKDSEFFCIEESQRGKTTIEGFSNDDVDEDQRGGATIVGFSNDNMLDIIQEHLWQVLQDRNYRRLLVELLMETA